MTLKHKLKQIKSGKLTAVENLMNFSKKIATPKTKDLNIFLSLNENAIEQAKQFSAATEVNALALTKLDGTAKGGVVIGISDQFNIPVKYIGIGEKMEDIQLFNRNEFVDSLFILSNDDLFPVRRPPSVPN